MPSELAQNLKLLMQSGNSLVSIETNDEQRVTKIVLAAASLRNATLYDWSMTRGLRRIGTDGVPGLPTVEGPKATATLDFIEQNTEGAIYVVRDFAPHCKDAFVVRMIRDLESTLEQRGATIIFLDSTSLPDDVRRLTVRFDVGWPTTDEIEQVIKQTYQKIRPNLTPPSCRP